MLGMDFVSFFILFIISVVVSAILHYGFKYYATPGTWSFFSKIVVGWLGGWLGSPILGHWFEGVNYGELYILPAIIGTAAMLIFSVDFVRMITAAKEAKPD